MESPRPSRPKTAPAELLSPLLSKPSKRTSAAHPSPPLRTDRSNASFISEPINLCRASLVSCPINKFTDTFDFGDNRIGGGGPDERSPMFIVVGHILLDFVDQLADVAKRAAPNRLLGYEPEPAFDLVEPA